MTTPLLSVTVMNYNYARFLDQNITSILSQTFSDFELILIDNASTDGSVAVMERYARRDPRVRVVAHRENLGMFGSLHESCQLPRGRYRVPIEADDWVLHADAFERQIELLESHPEMSFVFSRLTMIGEDGTVQHVSRAFDRDCVVPGSQAVEPILGFALEHSGMMMRMSALRASAGYREAFPHVCDMDLGAQLCAQGEVGYIDRSLFGFRQHSTNLHFSPQLQVVRREVLPVIEDVFRGPLGASIPQARRVERRITKRALVHLPTQYIFSGHVKTGWQLWWQSFRARPVETVVQRRTVALVTRSLLGRRGHGWLMRRLRPPSVPESALDVVEDATAETRIFHEEHRHEQERQIA